MPRTVTVVGQQYLYPVRGIDPDGNPVTFSLVSPPAGMQLSYDNFLSWTPTVPGDYLVSVKISDGKYHVTPGNPNDEYRHTQTFTLHVQPEPPDNLSPLFVSTLPKEAAINFGMSVDIYRSNLDHGRLEGVQFL